MERLLDAVTILSLVLMITVLFSVRAIAHSRRIFGELAGSGRRFCCCFRARAQCWSGSRTSLGLLIRRCALLLLVSAFSLS